jgi:hypothetical protein
MYETLIKSFLKNSAEIPVTTLIKLLKLRPEQGVTSVSLKNLEKIKKSPLQFEIKNIKFDFDATDPRLQTEWISKDNDVLFWDFRGFQAGYIGEGPRGLKKALQEMGINNITIEDIVNLKPGVHVFK